MLKWITLLTMLAVPAYAQTFRIGKITVEGFDKTEPKNIIREMELSEGQIVSLQDVEDGIQNLRDARIFYDLSHEIIGDGEQRDLKVMGKDRWTTIPVFKLSSGGGTTQAILGGYDANVLGKYFELGAQYERLGATNSGVFWYRDQWFGGERLFLDFQLWRTNRLRTKYLQEPMTAEEKMGFLLSRTMIYLGLTKHITKNFSLGLFYEKDDDKFSEDYVDEDIRKLNSGLPPDTNSDFVGLSFNFGRIKYNNFLVDGLSVKVDVKHAFVVTRGIDDFDAIEGTLLCFKTLPWESTFAQRVMLGTTTTDVLQYWYYLGGLDRIRGFVDNRFAGRHYWLSNTEYRIPSWKTGTFVLQHVFFYDAAGLSEDIADLNQANGASAGVGLRFIFPQVYRLVARLDFARNTVRRDEVPVSFGVQQFF